ncbi:MAG: hypothetical protein JWP91_4199 [Fibrobacteres bacterium]|nr:hypothetical protein [Fibrobacterota bacterium]
MLLLVLALSGALRSQPLLLIGKADATLSGAFSYEFLKSPLAHRFDEGNALVSLNLPFNASAQAQKLLGSVADSAVVIPELFARVSQHLNAHVDVSAPMFGGVAFFAARENASLTVSGALGNATFNLDTTLPGSGSVLLKGSIHMPLLFDMHWRSLSFGYAFKPSRLIELGFQVHKHQFTARTSGDLRPDLSGRIEVGGDAGNTSFLVEYPADKVYGTADGFYEGKAWSPEMAIGVGPVRLVSRMGARMEAKGHIDVTYSVPYFIDPGTFEPRFTEPDSFLASDNLRRLLDGETGKREIHIHDRLILLLPQSHTVSLDILPGRLSLSYTKVFGRVSIHMENPEKAAGARPAEDSGSVDAEGVVDLDLFPDQVICLATRLGWFHGDLGLHSLNMSYGDKGHMLSGLSPLEWDGDPLVPILDFGFTWGHPLVFNADFFISPLPAVRSGVSYAF